ncbi:GHMP kinase, partial [Thamnocephalis sphaerospora]
VRISVPASTSNIGPGFDVMGMALSLLLQVEATFTPPADTVDATDAVLTSWTIDYDGDSPETVLLDARKNLITRTAADVVARHVGAGRLPHGLHVHVNNPIPLGRGLGSSGAAVAAGVLLGSALGDLNLDLDMQLAECLRIEHHPDNVTAALAGGWVACWTDSATHRGGFVHLPVNKDVLAVAVSPRFEVKTAAARGVLPKSYSLEDVVFNLQRLTQLTVVLGAEQLDAEKIHRAMQDRVHQPYRQSLIPGMDHLLQTMTPASDPGLLGVCISGSGPTVLALVSRAADANAIAAKIQAVFAKQNIQSDARVLE